MNVAYGPDGTVAGGISGGPDGAGVGAGRGTGAIGGAGLTPGNAGTSGQVTGALKPGKSELL